MFAEFFVWWRQHLLECLPESLRRSNGPEANALVVDATDPSVLRLSRRRRGGEARLAQLRLDDPGLVSLRAALNDRPSGEPVLLRLPGHAALERPVSLPLAAERDVERVLTYEMERLTPFTPEEVFWTHGVTLRDRARGKLLLTLTLVPRGAVQGLIDTLTECGGRPALMEAETEGGTRILRLQHPPAASGFSRISPRNARYALAALAALVVVSPFLRQSFDLNDAQADIDALTPRMALVEKLRRQITGAGAGGDAVASETRRVGDVMQAIAAVTQILPNDSYLTELAMRERVLTLTGQSANAPRLISLLSSDQRIRNPSFTAPVTKSDKRDVFSIRAEMAPPGGS